MAEKKEQHVRQTKAGGEPRCRRKRKFTGPSHKRQPQVFPLYVAVFCFRYNNRENEDIFGRGSRLLIVRIPLATIASTLLCFFAVLLVADLLTSVPVSVPCAEEANSGNQDNRATDSRNCTVLHSALFRGRQPLLGVMADFATRYEGGIGALSGILLAVITGWLVFVARDQLRTTRAQLRAYIQPDVLNLKKFSLTEPIEIIVRWANCGQTPAKQFEAHGIVCIGTVPLPDDTSFEKPKEAPRGRHGRSTVFPQASTDADYIWQEQGEQISPAVWDAVTEGKLAIYVIAEAVYLDIFDRKHESRVCRFVEPTDAKILIEAERKNLPLTDLNIRWNASHVMNDFT